MSYDVSASGVRVLKSEFQQMKEHRAHHYYTFVFGFKRVKCLACNGSGYYDHHGSPPCDSCEGTGKSLSNTRSPELEAKAQELLQEAVA